MKNVKKFFLLSCAIYCTYGAQNEAYKTIY